MGDVAFIKHTIVPPAYASQFEYLCKDGTNKGRYKCKFSNDKST